MIREAELAMTSDAGLINGFANHPDIRPGIGGAQHGEIDLSSAVKLPNVYLFGEHGGICWLWSAPETFEAHTMITRAGRGTWALDAARQAIRFMQDRGAQHLWTRVHPEARHTALFTMKAGLTECGTHELDIGDGPVIWRLFNWRRGCP